MSLAPDRLAIGIRRHFTTPGVHPYDEVVWERRDARISNWKDGTVAFEQLGVEFPTTWSLNSTNIVAQKYFRGTLGTDERETSLRQVIDRVVDTITTWGTEGGYFADEAETESFRNELKFILVTQRAAFNSPVWFNIGVKDVPQQASACFILSVDDKMDSILNWYREEGVIFKGGSGAGVNLSKIRSSYELLNGGGTASGPVSFMRGADASAGTIKSGGKTRRAAKMVILNVDHPDVRGVRVVQGQGGEEGPRAARRRLRHGPRRQRLVQHPVPEREQLGPRHRRVHGSRRRTTPTGTSRPSPTAPRSARCGPATCGATSPPPRGSAPTRVCSSTPRSTSGTPRTPPAASTARTRAASTCTSTTRPATWPRSTCCTTSTRRATSTSRPTRTRSRSSSPPRRSSSAAPTTRPSRSARTAASSVSSASATPTSAPR